MLKAVLFDLDHTLYSRELTLQKLAPSFAEAMHLDMAAKAVVELLCEGDRYFYDEQYRFAGFPAVYKRITQFVDLPAFEYYREFMSENLGKCAVSYPFTQSVLSSCHQQGLRIGMVTNGRSGMQDIKVDVLGIRPYFDDIVMAGDLGILKPDPRVFLDCCLHLGVRPDEAIFVGDNPFEDISGSNSAGIPAVWIKQPRGFPSHLTPPAYRIDSIEELPALIAKLI